MCVWKMMLKMIKMSSVLDRATSILNMHGWWSRDPSNQIWLGAFDREPCITSIDGVLLLTCTLPQCGRCFDDPNFLKKTVYCSNCSVRARAFPSLALTGQGIGAPKSGPTQRNFWHAQNNHTISDQGSNNPQRSFKALGQIFGILKHLES